MSSLYRLDLMVPELFLFCWAILIFTVDLFILKKNKTPLLYLTQFGFLAAMALVVITPSGPEQVSFGFMFYNDNFASFFKIVLLLAGFMVVSSSHETVKKYITNPGEYFGLLAISTVGMMYLVSATELVSLYVALELSTIPLFVLAAIQKKQMKSSEAGLKYLILGALSSAFLLYGISFIYGMTGSTVLVEESIAMLLNSGKIQYGMVLSLVFILAGLGFKLAVVPFHMWAPDVYEGAPTPITAYLSVASKAAALAALARIIYGVYTVGTASDHWGLLIAVLASLAMIIGSVAAILQNNIKRMLAYSSIAQAGYILVGFVAASQLGISSISIYIFAYLFANLGAFAVVIAAGHKLESDQIKDYGALVKKSPFLAACLTVFLLSLAGIPPLAGFIAKYRVFMAAIENGNYFWLVMIAVATSVVSIFYYVRVVKEMFITEKSPLDKEGETPARWQLSSPVTVAILIGLIGTLIVGIYPQPFLDLADTVTQSFVY